MIMGTVSTADITASDEALLSTSRRLPSVANSLLRSSVKNRTTRAKAISTP